MIGLKVIDTPVVHEVRSFEDAAVKVAIAYVAGRRNVKVRARTSLTRDRDLTHPEQTKLVALATQYLEP